MMSLALGLTALALLSACGQGSPTVLRYAHMNARDSVAGRQAELFAARAEALSEGRLRVEVFPASGTGSLAEQLEQARRGVIDIHHTTAGALGSAYGAFEVLDTPYLVDDPERLARITARDSPLMARLDQGLRRDAGLALLYSFYFGSRQLTLAGPALRPADLAGRRVRAVPYPMYELTVEALGAVPVPIDWAETPNALIMGLAEGQENPPETILTARLYESQTHLLETRHILGASMVVMNARSLALLTERDRRALFAAAADASAFAQAETIRREAVALDELRARGMTVVGPDQGLDLAAFKARAKAITERRLGSRWAEYYRLIESIP